MYDTLPVVAPAGTGTTMLVALQLEGVAAVPLNLTVLLPCVAPKFVPATVTAAPTAPEVGETLAILGAETTVKLDPLLATPDTVTTTFPVVAPLGTVATILCCAPTRRRRCCRIKLDCAASLRPPKVRPVMVTEAPTALWLETSLQCSALREL